MRHVFLLSVLVSFCTLVMPQQAFAFDLNLDNLNVDKLLSIAKKTQDLKPADDKAEFEIGNGVASNLLGAAPLSADDKLQAYVNRLGWWLALQTERPDIPWHFGVLETDTVNAFAAPGGYVFVTRGLLLKMRNEAELAGVLSHEIAHVLKRHHLNAIQKNAQTGLLADIASLAVDNSRHAELAQKAITSGTELYARGLDKDDEYEADRVGVVIATRAGYDPYGLPAVLQTLAAQNSADSSLALMFKTHPAPQARLEKLDGAMFGSLDKYASQQQEKERFLKVISEYIRK